MSEFKELRVKSYKGDIINDILLLSAGLDFAIDSVEEGEISKHARKELRKIISEAYQLFAARIAHSILLEEGCIKKEVDISNLLYQFDLPDDKHDDVVILYRPKD